MRMENSFILRAGLITLKLGKNAICYFLTLDTTHGNIHLQQYFPRFYVISERKHCDKIVTKFMLKCSVSRNRYYAFIVKFL
jgi:hypothetical protein